ncbi:MAG: hypothetical protein ABII00_12135 [Elusimicrobiota bacterium]
MMKPFAKSVLLFGLCSMMPAAVIRAQEPESAELEALRRRARSEASQEEAREEVEQLPVFKSGAVGLQALNPEISVTGDMWAQYKDDQSTGDTHRKFNFRGLGLHIESYLDPYTRFKTAIGFNGNGAEFEEAYFIRYGLLPDVNLMAGKFRQQFGVVNRWHKHGLDQFDHPLALRRIFGDEGLNQIGASFEWAMPELGAASQQLDIQTTNGTNASLFSENNREKPSILARYKNYRDLTDATYLEMGLSGLVGWNDRWTLASGAKVNGTRATGVYGADLTLFWEPTGRMRYRDFLWRTEGYVMTRSIQAPDGSGQDTINAWGMYSNIQTKVSRTVEVGLRGDFYRPDTKAYSSGNHAVTRPNPYQWQAGPYLTWHQSPFIRFRIEYDHLAVRGLGAREDVVIGQAIFSAGPHKHDRY